MKTPTLLIAFSLAFSLSSFAGEKTVVPKKKKLNLKPQYVTAEDPNAAFHLLKKEPGNPMEKKFKNIGKESSPINCSETNMGGGSSNHTVACSRVIEGEPSPQVKQPTQTH